MNISLGAAKNIARVLGVSIDSLAEYETPNLLSSLSRTQLQQAPMPMSYHPPGSG